MKKLVLRVSISGCGFLLLSIQNLRLRKGKKLNVCDFFSVEEAKKKIYACKTTTYPGFQAVMTEEESKKFEGICFLFPLRLDFIDLV